MVSLLAFISYVMLIQQKVNLVPVQTSSYEGCFQDTSLELRKGVLM